MTFTISLPLGLVLFGFVIFIVLNLLDPQQGLYGSNGKGCIGFVILIVCCLLAAGIWLGQAIGGAA